MNRTWIDNIVLGVVALGLAVFLGATVAKRNADVRPAYAAGGEMKSCVSIMDQKIDKFYVVNTQKNWIGVYKFDNDVPKLVSCRDYTFDLALPTTEGRWANWVKGNNKVVDVHKAVREMNK